MEKKRRKYSREFKVEAVKMITEQGLSAAEVARDLGVNPSVVQNWKRKFADEGDQAFPGNGRVSGDQERIRALEQELRQVRMERDISKKATAFFASQSK